MEKARRRLEEELRQRYPSHTRLFERAASAIPSGVAHDSRHEVGFPPPFFERGSGPFKFDAGGSRFVDYWMGHGALLLGHGREEVVRAVRRQALQMTHAGGCHEKEVEWAEIVKELIPSAELVRFTSSGTESVMLALRLARVHTGREKTLKFEGHFHGWSDYAMAAVSPPFDLPAGAGVPAAVLDSVRAIPADEGAAREALSTKEFACVILEPTGASGGTVALPEGFLAFLREECDRTGTVLVFDEVITGFRISPGGEQARSGVTPDLTLLGKVLAGGLPGSAVAGKEAILSRLRFTGAEDDRARKVAHWGTFNSNPLSAAAGVAALSILRSGRDHSLADSFTARLKDVANEVFRKRGVRWCLYADSSVFHFTTEARCDAYDTCDRVRCRLPADVLKGKTPIKALARRALLLEGVNLPSGTQAWTSSAHTENEADATVSALDAAIERLKRLGVLR